MIDQGENRKNELRLLFSHHIVKNHRSGGRSLV